MNLFRRKTRAQEALECAEEATQAARRIRKAIAERDAKLNLSLTSVTPKHEAANAVDE